MAVASPCSPSSWLRAAALVAVALAAAPVGSRAGSPAAAAVLVEVTRGPVVESRHRGHLVVVTPEGQVVHSAGNPHALVLSRSTLKPLQALATVRLALEHGVELTSEEIAIACASHAAEPYQVAAVTALLARASAGEAHLHCGPEGGSRLRNGCSGKHGAMLVQARLGEAPLDGYWRVDHPVQRRIQRALREFTGHEGELEWGTDGCGVPNYALPLDRLAVGFARLANPDAAPPEYRAAATAIRAAMLAHPGHLSREGSFHAQLMEAAGGRLAGKGGAEACYGLGLSEPRLGVAIKIEDGNARGMAPLLLAALERVGAVPPAMAAALAAHRTLAVKNSRDEVVGEIRAAAW